jgi:hypothetical protein
MTNQESSRIQDAAKQRYNPNAFCPIIKKGCNLCTVWKGTMYCGEKTGENRVQYMTKCPKKTKRK